MKEKITQKTFKYADEWERLIGNFSKAIKQNSTLCVLYKKMLCADNKRNHLHFFVTFSNYILLSRRDGGEVEHALSRQEIISDMNPTALARET